MTGRAAPPTGMLLEWGADDRVFDALLVAGPLLIVLIAVIGRRPLSMAAAALYVLVFLGRAMMRYFRGG